MFFNSVAAFLNSSDITITLADRKMLGHRFILTSRSQLWADKLPKMNNLDLTKMTPSVATSMIHSCYDDSTILPSDLTAVIELLKAARKYRLEYLKNK